VSGIEELRNLGIKELKKEKLIRAFNSQIPKFAIPKSLLSDT
jgi:hypothetical protein